MRCAANRFRHPLGVLRHEEPRKIGAGHGRGERDAEGETTPRRAGGAVGLLAPVRRLMALRARPSPPFKLRARRAFALAPNANRRVAPMARDRRRPARFRTPASAPPYAASGISP